MFCANCGNQIPDNAAFCPKCGNKTVAAPNDAASQPNAEAPRPDGTNANFDQLQASAKEFASQAGAAASKIAGETGEKASRVAQETIASFQKAKLSPVSIAGLILGAIAIIATLLPAFEISSMYYYGASAVSGFASLMGAEYGSGVDDSYSVLGTYFMARDYLSYAQGWTDAIDLLTISAIYGIPTFICVGSFVFIAIGMITGLKSQFKKVIPLIIGLAILAAAFAFYFIWMNFTELTEYFGSITIIPVLGLGCAVAAIVCIFIGKGKKPANL